ncbi:MAG: hypothetical protein U0794_19320 [Isosphaeraceae bacterium]
MRPGVWKSVWLLVAAATASTACGRVAWGGPARYDTETRSIRFTYTYASLAEGQFGEAAIGAPQTPSTDQDALVRTVVLKVSDALSKATSGRLKISSLDIVSDVRRADVVISLTGDPGRGGWAIPGAIEGRPGQIGLYYRTLAKEWEQDFVLTAAHEVCHYVFGLVDEYNFPNGCPQSNPGGPGCLMDNYLSMGTRHGWYGRLCADDHNTNPQQRDSCQSIVDKFFRDRGVTTLGPPGGDDPASQANTLTERTDSIIENITRATVAKVREEAEALSKDRKPVNLSSLGSLRTLARSFFESQLKKSGVALPSDDVGNRVDGILKHAGSIVRFAIPPRFDPIVGLIAKFAESRAREIKEKFPKESELSRRQKVAKALLAFVSGLGSNAPTANGPLTTDERRYLELVAMQAASITEEEKRNDELYEATLAHIKLDRQTARNVLDIASEVGVVGIEKRLEAAGEVDADLRRYMPGRTASSGFGLRRTIVVDPDPIDPRDDFVVTQTGIYRASDLRDRYTEVFQRLVARAQIELLTTNLQDRRNRERRESLNETRQERIRKDRAQRIAELADRGRVRSQREAELRTLLTEVIDQVRRNRIENIVFVVPPGGLPAEMSVQFESLRRALIIKGDVRLDVVVMGASEFPAALRDICIGTGGSVISFTSLDEVGALAQRLKNDQTAGAWVILPHQDTIKPVNLADKETDRWLIEDAKSGRFLNPDQQPIDAASALTLRWLKQIQQYFAPRTAEPGKLLPSDAERDLKEANRMPPEVIHMLDEAILESLLGTNPYAARDDQRRAEALSDEKGLIDEVQYLTTLVKNFNNRVPGTGDTLKFEIIEHLIRARALENETRRLVLQAMSVHATNLNPDYDEDQIFREAYKAAKGEYDTRRKTRDKAESKVDTCEYSVSLDIVLTKLDETYKKYRDAVPQTPARKTEFASTIAYIGLKQQEVRLRVVRAFLEHISEEISKWGDHEPLFRRVNREALVRANEAIVDRAPGFIAGVPGQVSRSPLPPIDTVLKDSAGRPLAIRLPRFYAENQRFDPAKGQAEFELVLGFSQALPGVDGAAIRDNDASVLPELRLYNDNGQLANTPSLMLDRDLSTPTCLIYRFSPEFGETGWYTAALKLNPATRNRIVDDINFTFSIASTRPNFHLTALQLQAPNDLELVPPPPTRGMARVMDRRVKVQVQVYGGTSILGASIRGVLYKLDNGKAEINPIAQDFFDDGKTYQDVTANDGVYSSIISLDQVGGDNQGGGGIEYRVLIQAQSTETSRNIAPEDPNKGDAGRRAQAAEAGDRTVRKDAGDDTPSPEPTPAQIFQRATSIQIRVER